MINIRVSNEQGEVLKELQLGEGTHNIGRTPDNTIELRDMKVSRDHAKLMVQDGVCTIVDTNSTTGVFVNEEKILSETELRTGDVVHIGDMVLDVSFEEFSGTKLEGNQIGCLRLVSGGVNSLHALSKTETIMGRIPECDIQVMDQMASRQHSKVILQGGSYFIEDCNSSNGTFLNDIQITKQPLQNGDVVKICNHAYKFEIKDKSEVQMQVSSPKPTPPPAPSPHGMISTTRPTRATPPTMHGYEVSENKKKGSFTKVAAILVIFGLVGVGGYTYKDKIMDMVNSKGKDNSIDKTPSISLSEEIAAAELELNDKKSELQNLISTIQDSSNQLQDIEDQINNQHTGNNDSSGKEEVEQLKADIAQTKQEGKKAVSDRNSWKKKAKKVYAQYKKMPKSTRPNPPREEVKPPREEVKPPREEVKPPREEVKPPREEVKPPREEVKPPREEVKPQGNVALTAAQIAEIKKINAIKNKPVDYKKIVTANRCGECHKQEKKVWQQTPHHETFKKMSKKPRAKSIFKKLKIKGSIKRSGRCSKCHFLQQHDGRKVKAVAGVSCESCHGAGKDWVLVHNDRSVPIDKRRVSAMSKGMNNPSDIYLIAQNCYGCHSVPDEDLVNIGGHKAGSSFELVSWSQGMVRHNFVRADNKANQKSSPARLRVMFVTGLMLDLEYSLRGLMKVTKPGKYYDTMQQKVNKTYKVLNAANNKSGGIKEIKELLTLFKKLNMKNRKHLEAGANLVTLKAREFTKNHNGSKLSSLDAFIPKNYK
ncbi:FHA domain-containing protein [Candidatus Uabimicrobium sp. HlEnr_7]|uniref:FHA domain-containing protein n=1 Tax=Candidatus Uabimicrobium helgolandensis TaxID=3095367 RepID=UPI00355691EB